MLRIMLGLVIFMHEYGTVYSYLAKQGMYIASYIANYIYKIML